MDFKDTPEQAKFRKTCREWLEKNAKLKTGVEKNEFANIDFLQVAKDWQKKNMMLVGPCYIGQRNLVVLVPLLLKELFGLKKNQSLMSRKVFLKLV